ncbi:MAG: hypothetical protein ACK5L0_07315 [Candidatus Fimivivens sp.]
MDIPGGARARAALSMMYGDTATIARSRVDAATDSVVTQTVYEGVRCHLSIRRGLGERRTAAFRQTEAQAQTNAGYTVFFAVGITVQPGDFLTVTHGTQMVRGRAGLADYGALGVTVSLDGVVIA